MATRVHWLNFLKFIIMIHFLLSPHNESHPSLPERQKRLVEIDEALTFIANL
jgi:hypothetical protein